MLQEQGVRQPSIDDYQDILPSSRSFGGLEYYLIRKILSNKRLFIKMVTSWMVNLYSRKGGIRVSTNC